MYISFSTKTRDRHPGLLQFTCLLFFSCLPCVVTRSPAALTVPVVYSSRDQVPSTPCVIFIADHVLLSATPTRPKSGKRVQCALHFKVTQVMSPVNYRLELPTQWSIHPVFHISSHAV